MAERSAQPPRWLLITFAVIAAAAVAFAIGRFTTFPAASDASAPTTDSAEAGFARDMQVHHAQAIDMAMTIYRTTADEPIKALAYDIATNQSAQKGEFFDWLVRWNLPQAGGPLMAWMAGTDAHAAHGGTAPETATEAELMDQMGMATQAQLDELAAAEGTEADCLFLELMIRHHEGALPMGQALLELGSDPRALNVADAVVSTQSAEIDLMRSMQARLSCTG